MRSASGRIPITLCSSKRKLRASSLFIRMQGVYDSKTEDRMTYSHPVALPASKTAVYYKDAQGQLVHRAKLAEDPLQKDKTSIHGNQDVPPFHGYSKKGTAQGQLVYAYVSTGISTVTSSGTSQSAPLL